MKRRWLMLLILVPLLLAAVPVSGQEGFQFHGLRFGLSRAEVNATMPLRENETSVKDPGHGMTSLFLLFDKLDRLMEIRASYLRPDDPLESEGLRRALRQRYIAPVKTAHPDILVVLDEYANRAAFTLSFLSTKIKEENIESFKKHYLEAIE